MRGEPAPNAVGLKITIETIRERLVFRRIADETREELNCISGKRVHAYWPDHAYCQTFVKFRTHARCSLRPRSSTRGASRKRRANCSTEADHQERRDKAAFAQHDSDAIASDCLRAHFPPTGTRCRR